MTKSEVVERLEEMVVEAEEKRILGMARNTPGGALYFHGIAAGLTKALAVVEELDNDNEDPDR